jgi:uncharacterized protein YndB with AHSA1/START domain
MQTFDKTYHLPFDIETTYTHWISNDTVIAPASRMEIEAKAGGAYRLVMPGEIVMNGVFSEVVPNKALTYSWQWQGSDEQTHVNVQFSANDNDKDTGTDVRIVHSGFTSQDSYDNHASGWDSYIDGFTLLVGT